MKTTLIAAVALFSLASTAAFAASEDYPAPVTRPIYSVLPGGNDAGSNGAAFGTGITAQVDDSQVMLNNSTEAEADSLNSLPGQVSDRPVYAVSQDKNHG